MIPFLFGLLFPFIFLFMYCPVLYFSMSRMWSSTFFFYRIPFHSSVVNGSTQRQASSIRRMWLTASPNLTCGGTDSDRILDPSKDSCAVDHTYFIAAGLLYHLYSLPEIVSLRLNVCRRCRFPACRKMVFAEYHCIVVYRIWHALFKKMPSIERHVTKANICLAACDTVMYIPGYPSTAKLNVSLRQDSRYVKVGLLDEWVVLSECQHVHQS